MSLVFAEKNKEVISTLRTLTVIITPGTGTEVTWSGQRSCKVLLNHISGTILLQKVVGNEWKMLCFMDTLFYNKHNLTVNQDHFKTLIGPKSYLRW